MICRAVWLQWKEFVNKNDLFRIIKSGKIIEDKPAYLCRNIKKKKAVLFPKKIQIWLKILFLLKH
jgi:hypothetical protein